jgi:Ran GTPase-activating protein (RanGAP) involved in mRNA processing and transport
MTYDQLLTRQQRAINFVRNVLQDEEHAFALEDETPEQYAARKRLVITNPHPTRKENTMTQATKAQLQDRIDELESSNQELQDKLDAIADVVRDEDDSSADDGSDDSDDSDDQDSENDD